MANAPTDRARFERIRARYLAVEDRRTALEASFLRHYRKHAPFDHELLTSERQRRDAIRVAGDKVGDAMFALLDRISPRPWRTGVPYTWIMLHLTWDDATTAGALTVTPPPAWGASHNDVARFAAPVRPFLREVSHG